MHQQAIELLRKYTDKRYIYLTQRGNKSILLALKIAKAMGKKKAVVQDQGGWITYLQYPETIGMQLVKFKTDYGVVIPNDLSKVLDSESVVLINSLTGYFAEQPMALTYSMCKQKNALLINDASGSIGTDMARLGDIILGSFGDGKPIDLDYGGFIAFDDIEFSRKANLDDNLFDKNKINSLVRKLEKLPEKQEFLEKASLRIKKDLSAMSIIHPSSRGINVIVAFKDKFERERIINYCNANNYEWTECPRYIRVNAPAISIEVKRIKSDVEIV